MLTQGLRVCVAEPHRMLGNLDGVHGRPVADMRKIDHHSQTIHFFHKIHAERAQAHVLALVATGPGVVEVVVGQLHHPNTEPVEDLDQAQVVLDGRRVLKTENDTDSVLPFRGTQVRERSGRTDPLRVGLEVAVEPSDVLERLLRSFPNGDGGVNGRESSFVQVAVDCRVTPPAHIEPVDDDRASMEIFRFGTQRHASLLRPCYGLR